MKLRLVRQSIEYIFNIIYYAIKHFRMFFQLNILQFVIFLKIIIIRHITHTHTHTKKKSYALN